MRSLTRNDDLKRLDDTGLAGLLDRLETEERAVSQRRTAVHRRIEFLKGGGFASANPADEPPERLDELVEAEREHSEQRRLLHRQIDLARAEESRRRSQR